MMVYRFQCDLLARVFRSIRSWSRTVRRGVGEALFRCYFFEACILVLYFFGCSRCTFGAAVWPLQVRQVCFFMKVVEGA